MSIESMLSALEHDAEAEKKKILEETQRQIAAILSEDQIKADSIRRHHMNKARDASDIEEAKALGSARSQASNMILQARKQAFEIVYARARERIRTLTQDNEYPQILAGLIQEAASGLSGRVAAEVAPQDVHTAQQIFKRLNISADIKASPAVFGGVILKSDEQRMVIENTLESRLAKVMQAATSELASVLWKTA